MIIFLAKNASGYLKFSGKRGIIDVSFTADPIQRLRDQTVSNTAAAAVKRSLRRRVYG